MSVSSAPTTDAVLTTHSVSSPPAPARSSVGRIARVLLALMVIAAAAALAMQADQFRHVEAWLAALWMNPLIEGGVVPSNDSFMLWVADDHLVAFRVTAECTAVILLVPQLVLGGGLLLSRRIRLGRGLAGIGVMVALVMLVNQLRLGLIGWATQQGGLEAGYEISHRYVGSAIGIAGFVIALVAMLLVMGLRARRRR